MDVSTVVINVTIPIVMVVGFFIFYGKSNGWFQEGRLSLRMVEK